MRISTLFSATTIATAYFEDAFAGSSDEQVWLLNCIGKDGARRSELALYPDFPGGFPISTVTVPTPYNTTFPWEYANITEKLPGGPVFASSEFGLPSVAGASTGLAKLGLDDLTCLSNVVDGLYSTIEGSVCSSVFQCAHSGPTPDDKRHEALKVFPTQKVITANAATLAEVDRTKVIFIAYDEKVVVSGKLTAGDIFWNVWGERDGFHFSGKKKEFGSNGCTVRYEGHGDIEWATTNGLATTLLTIAQADKFLQYSSYKKRECETTCENPGHPTKCCSWKMNTYWETHIPSRVDFQVINVPADGSGRNPSDQGNMNYFIECPAVFNIGCFFCHILEDILSGGSQIGGIGGATDVVKGVAKGFGVANLLTQVSCQAAGC